DSTSLSLISCAREEPPERPRRPVFKALSTAFHVSPFVPAMGPDSRLGNSPPSAKYESAQFSICCSLRSGSSFSFRTPRFSARNFARDEPPEKPRRPLNRALSTPAQVSPPAPSILPEFALGHKLVFKWCVSAHSKTFSSVSAARFWQFRTPRLSS